MRALDTDVLVRFFVDDPDDPEAAKQRPAAVTALSGRCFVPVTVLLEFEWVLRGFYELPRRQIADVMRALAGLEQVTIEDRGAVLVALDALDAGVDFADSLHVTRSARAIAFATFDRRLARRGKRAGFRPVIELLG